MNNLICVLKPHLNSAELNIVQGTNVAKRGNLQSFFGSFLKYFICLLLLFCICRQSEGAMPFPSFIIVMEGDVLKTQSEGEITKIEVFDLGGNAAFHQNGCYENVCRTNLSMLNSGQYVVKITTHNGNDYVAMIWIN